MEKIYKELTEDQKNRRVLFSSCLSVSKSELENDTIHEVKATDQDSNERIARLKNDKFFNDSHWKYNIIRS